MAEGGVLWSGVAVATYHSSLKCASKSVGQASGFFFWCTDRALVFCVSAKIHQRQFFSHSLSLSLSTSIHTSLFCWLANYMQRKSSQVGRVGVANQMCVNGAKASNEGKRQGRVD